MKKLALYPLILIFALVWTLPVSADKLTDSQKKLNSVDKQIQQLGEQKKQVAGDKKKLESEKNNLTAKQEQENKEYQELVDSLMLINSELEKIDESITDAEEEYNRKEELLKTRLRVMYENSNNSVIDILLQSKSITEFSERYELMSLVTKKDKELVKELDIAKKEIEYKRTLKAGEKQQTEGDAKKKQDRVNQLKVSRADLENEIREKQQKLKQLEAEEDRLLKESAELANTIKSLQRKGKYTGGTMKWPTPSSMSVGSSFGKRLHPIYKKWKMHTGIDIGASKGASIVAANKGTVIIAKYQRNGYGNYLVIDHGGGITTLYAHCSKLLVGVGTQVKAGQVIAYVGSTGLSTGPHLHFEVRENGNPVNPLKGYLSK
jgi:murein DD-endopeptidase MepM/ murein hydrolase activator NlpD